MPRLIIGLPHLCRGPLLEAALKLNAPIMISAGALAQWNDEGQVMPGHEFTLLEKAIRAKTNDTRPASAAQKKRRNKSFKGWNRAALDRIADLGFETHIDSAGFVAMAIHGGYHWTPESYVSTLCSHPAIHRFSAMDLCVEPEVASDRSEVDERIARTINLNWRCYRIAKDEGIDNKIMPVIQGANADDYLRCYDAISGMVGEGVTIGVGSMCRRPTKGPDGSTAILERLDRELPADVRLHLFGLKSDGAEAACQFGERIDSVDSQAYGVRARRIANDERAKDPSFSKTNAFVGEVMTQWYNNQAQRLAEPRCFPAQPEFELANDNRPKRVIDALEMAVRAQFNDLIATGALDHDQLVGGRMLEESVLELARELPEGVGLTDRWQGWKQLPADMIDEPWLPKELAA